MNYKYELINYMKPSSVGRCRIIMQHNMQPRL